MQEAGSRLWPITSADDKIKSTRRCVETGRSLPTVSVQPQHGQNPLLERGSKSQAI